MIANYTPNPGGFNSYYEAPMSDQSQEERDDNFADVCATVAIFALVVGTVFYWLSGMPS
jgi:hypothetical protein